MPVRYDIFECDEVQFETRRQVYHLGGAILAALILTALLAMWYQQGVLSARLLGLGSALVWGAAGAGLIARLRHLRRVVWCLKVSRSDLVGYDYARRRRKLTWHNVRRVELGDGALCIVGPESCRLIVPHRFSGFAALSHRVAAFAGERGVPVYVDGQPWQALDVYRFFPFLEEPPADASDATAV